MKRINLIALAVITIFSATVVLSGCDGYGSAPETRPEQSPAPEGQSEGGAVVVEKDLSFIPQEITVNVGDTVTFRNDESAPHIVRIDGQDLEQQAQGETVTWTAEKTGTFPYVCTIHPSMTGEVIVK